MFTSFKEEQFTTRQADWLTDNLKGKLNDRLKCFSLIEILGNIKESKHLVMGNTLGMNGHSRLFFSYKAQTTCKSKYNMYSIKDLHSEKVIMSPGSWLVAG